MSEDHTDPGELEGLIPPELLLTMSDGEPAIVCWRVEELDSALAAAHDMGLPVALAEGVVRVQFSFWPELPGSAEHNIGEEFYLAEEELADQ